MEFRAWEEYQVRERFKRTADRHIHGVSAPIAPRVPLDVAMAGPDPRRGTEEENEPMRALWRYYGGLGSGGAGSGT